MRTCLKGGPKNGYHFGSDGFEMTGTYVFLGRTGDPVSRWIRGV